MLKEIVFSLSLSYEKSIYLCDLCNMTELDVNRRIMRAGPVYKTDHLSLVDNSRPE